MVEAQYFAFEVLTLAASQFGSAHLAAQSVVVTVTSTTFNIPFPLSIAASTRVANLIGARLSGAAKTSAKVVRAIFFSFFFFLLASSASNSLHLDRHSWLDVWWDYSTSPCSAASDSRYRTSLQMTKRLQPSCQKCYPYALSCNCSTPWQQYHTAFSGVSGGRALVASPTWVRTTSWRCLSRSRLDGFLDGNWRGSGSALPLA